MISFEEPLKVAVLLADFGKPFYIAGGWAIDLYLNKVTRRHKDIEIAILRHDQLALQNYLTGWKLEKIVPKANGQLVSLNWEKGELLELPIHEIKARRLDGEPLMLEILLNESSGKEWKFRRNMEITRSLDKLGMRSELGIPILSPEVVLLYKAAKSTTDDEADFKNVLRVLNGNSQHWLRQAIKNCYPEHSWLTNFKLKSRRGKCFEG